MANRRFRRREATPEQRLAWDNWLRLSREAGITGDIAHQSFLAGWELRVIKLPTREAIAQAIRGEPMTGESPWDQLCEERRAPWLKDADRVLELMKAELMQP